MNSEGVEIGAVNEHVIVTIDIHIRVLADREALDTAVRKEAARQLAHIPDSAHGLERRAALEGRYANIVHASLQVEFAERCAAGKSAGSNFRPRRRPEFHFLQRGTAFEGALRDVVNFLTEGNAPQVFTATEGAVVKAADEAAQRNVLQREVSLEHGRSHTAHLQQFIAYPHGSGHNDDATLVCLGTVGYGFCPVIGFLLPLLVALIPCVDEAVVKHEILEHGAYIAPAGSGFVGLSAAGKHVQLGMVVHVIRMKRRFLVLL